MRIKEKLVSARNIFFRFIYLKIIKKIFFRIDPEKVHNFMLFWFKVLGSNFLTRGIFYFFWGYSNKALEQDVLGIHFKNPVGLAAGFDKDAVTIKFMQPLGFGYTEIGSVTGEKCKGNPKPRVWRLPKYKSIIINFGLKNDGAEIVSKRMGRKKYAIPVGISIAKTNCKETADVKAGIEDYLKAYKTFSGIGSYYCINISCPNAFGGEPFNDPEKLDMLMTEIAKVPSKKPIFLKMAADLSHDQIDAILEIAGKYDIAGFVCSNLTKDKKKMNIPEKEINHPGSLSGKPVTDLSDAMIDYIYRKTNGRYVIIGVGGIFSAKDAYRKIKLGASLLQLITGMVFEGPQLISEINQGLVELLAKDGYENISEAVGKGL